ncbi:MAG: hypothetical protein V3T75_02370 [candidate division Zixibacteria bacterium]
MKTFLYSLVLLLFQSNLVRPQSDALEAVKAKFSNGDCSHFEFANIIESKIFGVIDTIHGSAYIAKDGRYNIEIGSDVFLYDGSLLYTYFLETNQLIIEKPDSGILVSDEISFVIKLDEWYDSKANSKNSFALTKKEGVKGDIPDSLELITNSADSSIVEIRYIDINEDLNRVKFLSQKTDSSCSAKGFEPNFPDSVEKVKLY